MRLHQIASRFVLGICFRVSVLCMSWGCAFCIVLQGPLSLVVDAAARLQHTRLIAGPSILYSRKCFPSDRSPMQHDQSNQDWSSCYTCLFPFWVDHGMVHLGRQRRWTEYSATWMAGSSSGLAFRRACLGTCPVLSCKFRWNDACDNLDSGASKGVLETRQWKGVERVQDKRVEPKVANTFLRSFAFNLRFRDVWRPWSGGLLLYFLAWALYGSVAWGAWLDSFFPQTACVILEVLTVVVKGRVLDRR